MAIVVIDAEKNKLSYAGAYNPIILIHNTELSVINPDNMPVGRHTEQDISFTKKEIEIIKGDRIFLFTDGFKDQFGGDKDKKYSFKAFKNLILETSAFPIEKQEQLIQNSFETWKKNTDQIDDVLVIGIQIE
jgi:serine phosphatase RsbU (regulator of sigma subunit)